MTPEEQGIRDRQDALASSAYEKPKEAGSEGLRKLLAILAIVATPFLGAAAGGWIGAAVAPKSGPPSDPNTMMVISGTGVWVLYGILIGFVAGLFLSPIVGWLIWPRRARWRRSS